MMMHFHSSSVNMSLGFLLTLLEILFWTKTSLTNLVGSAGSVRASPVMAQTSTLTCESKNVIKDIPTSSNVMSAPIFFIKVSALLEHVSTPRRAATRTTSSIAALLKAVETGFKVSGTQEKLADFRYQLEPDPSWPGKLNVTVAEMD